MESECPTMEGFKSFSWADPFASHSQDRCGERSLPFLRQPLRRVDLRSTRLGGMPGQRSCQENPPVRFVSFLPETFQNDYETLRIVTNRRFSKISITKTQLKCACQENGSRFLENPKPSHTTSFGCNRFPDEIDREGIQSVDVLDCYFPSQRNASPFAGRASRTTSP